LPLLAIPPAARWLRRQARRFVSQDAAQVAVDVTQWHHYRLDWQATQAIFQVDNQVVLESAISPLGPLGLVVWSITSISLSVPLGECGSAHCHLSSQPGSRCAICFALTSP